MTARPQPRRLALRLLTLTASALAACTTVPPPTPAATSTPRSVVATATVLPSATLPPTAPPSRTPAPPSVTPPPTATTSPLAAAQTHFPSPDGQWTAHFFDIYVARLIVTDASGTIQWDYDAGRFDGETAYQFYRWAADGQALYFTTLVRFDGQAPPFYDAAGLHRLDLSTGQVTDLLPAAETFPSHLYVFALSPDDTQLAEVRHSAGQSLLALRTLATGQERTLALPGYTGAGSLLWSPAGDQLILALATDADWQTTGFTLAAIDTAQLTPPTLIYAAGRLLDPYAWVSPHEILLRDRRGGFVYLDLLTHATRAAPPDFTPAP